MNWVGDLAVEADVDVIEARGELSLDLVEAGRHFRATIDLKNGQARLAIIDGRDGQPVEGFAAEAATSVRGPGKYHLRFANVDDQLLLWVNDELVPFENSTYEPDELFPGGRKGLIPWASADGGDSGDLAPVGVGARGAKLEISRLAVLRDVYYIATDAKLVQSSPSALHLDYSDWRTSVQTDEGVAPALSGPRELFERPDAWNRFLTRRAMPFKVEEGQLFAMGDNSPFSSDCRLWTSNPPYKGKPGGPYLPRDLLIGKAICVFWPHSWGAIPGLPMLPGFPNFGDMRLVR
jgi:signal peptidase I